MNSTNIPQAPEEELSERLFRLEPRIRYVALNQKDQIKEIRQSPLHPSYNPPESGTRMGFGKSLLRKDDPNNSRECSDCTEQ
jgi:hypothetical protein